ncbi:Hypothetical predicted protein [Mytilus galloprovincialis]|uniref:Uncharacterized protein n=1 Tax=Mytilus galloprovincialis TaxID=29158 RepID=A0A8B6H7S0_MYTGA|nr:Hypothetical predicted protein [Mytilus galloprovincialis]
MGPESPIKDNIGVRRDELTLPTHKPKSKKVPELPAAYMNIKPAYLKTKQEPLILPDDITNILNHNYIFMSLQNEYEWLNTVRLTSKDITSENIAWSSFHSSERRGPTVEMSLSWLLSLFQEQAHSVATIKHSKDTLRDVFERLTKKPVLVSDADMELIEAFVVVMYELQQHLTSTNPDLNYLHASKDTQYDTIRPTRAALLDHTKLATYRGGHVWRQAVTHDQHLPSPGDWE